MWIRLVKRGNRFITNTQYFFLFAVMSRCRAYELNAGMTVFVIVRRKIGAEVGSADIEICERIGKVSKIFDGPKKAF